MFDPTITIYKQWVLNHRVLHNRDEFRLSLFRLLDNEWQFDFLHSK